MDQYRKALVPRHIRQMCKKAAILRKELKKLNQQPTGSLQIETERNREDVFSVKYSPANSDAADSDSSIDSITTTDESSSDSDDFDQAEAPFTVKEETNSVEGFNEEPKAGSSKEK